MSPIHLFKCRHCRRTNKRFPAPPKWTVWPGSRLKPEVSALIFLPPRHIAMTTDIEITPSPGRGRKRKPGWHHTVALLWYTRRGGFIQASWSRMSIQPSEGERSAWMERGGGRGLGQRAVRWIQSRGEGKVISQQVCQKQKLVSGFL